MGDTYALSFRKLGYEVVPVYATNGTPCVPHNRDVHYSDEQLIRFGETYEGDALGLRCGMNGVVALDVDVDDERVAGALRAWIVKNLSGKVVFREREGTCRFAVLFRVGEDDLVNGHSAGFELEGFDKLQQIEYAAYNQVLTIHGIHRKTGDKYTLRPKGLRAQDLASIPRKRIQALFRRLRACCT